MPQQPDFNWLMERIERCEAQIWSTAAAVMATGTSVVLDLGLLRRSDRARVAEIARLCELPAQFHYLTAPKEIRRGRVLSRNQIQGDGFSFVVTPEMFDFTEGVFEAPDAGAGWLHGHRERVSPAAAMPSPWSAASLDRQAPPPA
jgi:predicted kinase